MIIFILANDSRIYDCKIFKHGDIPRLPNLHEEVCLDNYDFLVSKIITVLDFELHPSSSIGKLIFSKLELVKNYGITKLPRGTIIFLLKEL